MRYEYSPLAVLAFAKAQYRPEDREKLILTDQFYSTQPTDIATNTQRPFSIAISAQADFILCGINCYSSLSAFVEFAQSTMLVTDTSSGQTLSQGPVMLASYMAGSQVAHSLPHPVFLPGNTAVSINIANDSASNLSDFHVVLSGFNVRKFG